MLHDDRYSHLWWKFRRFPEAVFQRQAIFYDAGDESPFPARADHFLRRPPAGSLRIQTRLLCAPEKWWVTHAEVEFLAFLNDTEENGWSAVAILRGLPIHRLSCRSVRSLDLHVCDSFRARPELVRTWLGIGVSYLDQMRKMGIVLHIFSSPFQSHVRSICEDKVAAGNQMKPFLRDSG